MAERFRLAKPSNEMNDYFCFKVTIKNIFKKCPFPSIQETRVFAGLVNM